MNPSRKVIIAVLGILGAIAGVLKTEFGLALNVAGLFGFLGAAVIYIQQEAKLDKERMKAQAAKWRDPKFYIAIVSAVIVALPNAGINLPLSPDIITAVLAVILGIIFKVKPT